MPLRRSATGTGCPIRSVGETRPVTRTVAVRYRRETRVAVDQYEDVENLAAVVRFVRGEGVLVDEPVMLRSTNNVVAWLAPSDLVAKISNSGERLRDELAVALVLQSIGAPIVSPHPQLGDRIHKVAGRDVSFWVHLSQDDAPAVSSAELAIGLATLLQLLPGLGDCSGLVIPSIGDEIARTLNSLTDPTYAPELRVSDRVLLSDALSELTNDLAAEPRQVIHGSPHRFNVLSSGGHAMFIDFETISRGPIEWDLAHLEPAVAESYPNYVDAELLGRCRTSVSATTAAQCWDALDRGPDMRWHAEHHLALVRATHS